MKTVRKLALAVVLMVATMFAYIVPAEASSAYDEIIRTTDTLVLASSSGGSEQPIAYSWKNEFDAHADASLISSLNQGIQSGSYAVVQRLLQPPYQPGKYVEIYWCANSPGSSQIVANLDSPEGYALTPQCVGEYLRHATMMPEPEGIGVYDDLQTEKMISGLSTWFGEYKVFLSTFSVTYPVGYEGALVPTEAPSAKYVAMGDSFSSGEGNPAFEVGTDVNNVNECHRSSDAYPRLLQADSSLDLGSAAFVACSGATTTNVLFGGAGAGNWNEGPQVDALSANTEVVTITIGGNDVGFREFATACTTGLCNFSTSYYNTILGKIDNDLPDSLDEVLGEILSRIPSSAKVYVIGYPHIAPAPMPTGLNGSCFPLNGQLDDPSPALNDGAAVRYVVDRLNGTISSSVDNANDTRMTYVDPNGNGSPFIGHDWCQQDRYFHIIAYNNLEYSFHPTSDGHIAYKTIIEEVIN